jgi:RNA recognition motif-containing protein
MEKTIYVGNLPFSSSETEVQELFSQHGTVYSVKMILDRDTGRPRGYGFVAMEESAAQAAIQALDGQSFGGRSLRVNEARRKESSYQVGRRPGY